MTEVHRIRVFDYTPSSISSISLNTKGDTLVVGRESGYLEIWNIKENAFVMASFYVTFPDNLKSVAWCKYHDEPAIAVGLLTGELFLIQYPSLKFMRPTHSYGHLITLAVNKKQDRIVTACGDSEYTGHVNIFNPSEELSFVASSDKFVSAVLCVCFDDSGYIYAGAHQGRVAKIDPENGRILTCYEVGSPVLAVTAVPGGHFATGDRDGNVHIWDPMTATVIAKFNSHKANIRALAANDQFLWASGVDPTVVKFGYNKKNGLWAQAGSSRNHTHEVTCLAASDKTYAISGSLDSTLYIKDQLFPFQYQPPISSTSRDGDLIVAGATGHQLSIWKLDSKQAKLELNVKTDNSKNCIECVALSPSGNELAYSASAVKLIKRNQNGMWEYDNKTNLPPASFLVYSKQGILFMGFLDGTVRFKKGSINVGFPVFRIAISSNGEHIVAGGIDKMVLLDKNLTKIETELPNLGTPFSTFAFQPFKNRLFISTGSEKVAVFNVLKKELLPKLTTKFGKFKDVAVNTISFAVDNPSQILLASSQRAIVRNLKKPDLGLYRLPYNDILYVTFAGPKQIIIFEKPWTFTISSLPEVYRMKRFMARNEENLPRY
ncbi:hypothetical protein TRFO_02589 [Tritrichomonas foetus]|uniref:Anaphase-promoting complex subunit 4 WD40 domain-containing protein n=1 Tax=Tritrichomonas foetus TaxID=1144522 RepID=A0A1J4L1Z3_9EUKA|nr:hypothetical protein TRFO_02589 [Tritrichomonas foetus]|eukprot:OHT17535.1 hypothetical protein TRFO_02589 [Tritrichomonas foetus]